MQPVNMLEAKSSLSRLVDALERGVESEIVIARNGKPATCLAAKMVDATLARHPYRALSNQR
jgi:antitoxin (DNA-binding transcriptional repressor) of toxin-antitoxin stability system